MIKQFFFFKRFYLSINRLQKSHIINHDLIESTILDNSLKFIPNYGFKEECILQAIKSMNLSDGAQSIFMNSPYSKEFNLIIHWLKTQREKLELYYINEKNNFANTLTEFEKVAFFINKRLEFNIPVINHISGALKTMIKPDNFRKSFDELQYLNDDIAFYCGDNSNDSNWYFKRLVYSSIYVTSEFYMLQDKSPNFSKTRDFVEKKLSNLITFKNHYKETIEYSSFLKSSLINIIKNKLKKI